MGQLESQVLVYPDAKNKPPPGEGLNKPATVTMHLGKGNWKWPIETEAYVLSLKHYYVFYFVLSWCPYGENLRSHSSTDPLSTACVEGGGNTISRSEHQI